MTPIRKVGIIGTGQMGSGIAHVVALSGYDVLLSDLSKERVDKGLEAIGKNLSRQIASGKITEEESKQALARISYAESYQDLADADLVIEAATEDETVKRKIFVALCPFLKADAIVATNTSSISITRLAAATDRPERFIGLHFMNPVPVMELVEMIRGIATEDVTFVRAREFVETLGKTTAVSEDFPAFMVNRVLLPMINEAVYTLYEGVGSVDAIDTAIRLGAHHPMGPLQLADFIGLDTCLSIMQVLYEGLADSKYRPCPLLGEICRGWLARAEDEARLLRLSRRKADAHPVRQDLSPALSRRRRSSATVCPSPLAMVRGVSRSRQGSCEKETVMPHLGPALDQPIPLSELLQVGLELSPDEAALLSRKGDASWSELDAVANGLAANYLALGLKPGDRFASLMPNRIALIAHYLACFKAGLVLTPLNYRYTPPEIDHALPSAARASFSLMPSVSPILPRPRPGKLPLGIIAFGPKGTSGLSFESLATAGSGSGLRA